MKKALRIKQAQKIKELKKSMKISEIAELLGITERHIKWVLYDKKNRIIKKRTYNYIKYTNAHEMHKDARLIVLKYYSKKGIPECSCCKENHIEFLCIDHIDGKGSYHRKLLKEEHTDIYRWIIKNKFPKGFQVLCYNCNIVKRDNNGNFICPHKRDIK